MINNYFTPTREPGQYCPVLQTQKDPQGISRKWLAFGQQLAAARMLQCFVLLIAFFYSTGAFAQTFPSSSTQCVANDMEVVKATLGESCISCTTGTDLLGTLELSVKNTTNSTRRSFAYWARVEITNPDGTVQPLIAITGCEAGPWVGGETRTVTEIDPIPYECGSSIRLIDVFLAWTDAADLDRNTCEEVLANPDKISPKCGRPQEVKVTTPPSAPILTPIQPTCTEPTGSITIVITSGLEFSVNGGDYAPYPTGGYTNLAPGTYTITSKNGNNCISPASQVTINNPPATPGAPSVGVVNNCDGTSTLTATNYTGSLLWSNGATTAAITVSTAGTYTVTQTVNGCTSANGSGVAAPKTAPGAPSVSPVTYCQYAMATPLTATGDNLKWFDANNAPLNSAPIPNTAIAGTVSYYVSQTVNGCESPKAKIDVVVNICVTNEGCTPGYWKNRKASWNTVTFADHTGATVTRNVRACVIMAANSIRPINTPANIASELKNALFREVFYLTSDQVVARLGKGTGNITLIQALDLGDGSGYTQLGRAGTAALLNSCAQGYAYSSNSIVSNVRARFLSTDKAAALSLALMYDKANNGICRLENSSNAVARMDNSSESVVEKGITLSAFPNPFSSIATFEFSVGESTDASLELYTITGIRVATLYKGKVAAGQLYNVDFSGNGLRSGTYVYRLSTPTDTKYGRIVLTK